MIKKRFIQPKVENVIYPSPKSGEIVLEKVAPEEILMSPPPPSQMTPPSIDDDAIEMAVQTAKRMQEAGVRAPYAIKVTSVTLFPAVPVMFPQDE